jgi:hypothetical protein
LTYKSWIYRKRIASRLNNLLAQYFRQIVRNLSILGCLLGLILKLDRGKVFTEKENYSAGLDQSQQMALEGRS